MTCTKFQEQCVVELEKLDCAHCCGIGSEIAEKIRALPLPEVKQEPIYQVQLSASGHFADEGKSVFDCWVGEKRIVYLLPPDAEVLRKENEQLRKENERLRQQASFLENACAFQSVELSAIQLREARDFIFVDDGEEEAECVARIAQLPYDRAPIGDNNVRMKPGLYVCDAEYPEEGWMPLFEGADNEPDAALKGGAA